MAIRYDRVIVLGAGIQGACAALALARRGHAVTLVDEAPGCLLRASLVNEGKIHLGHVYANDPTFETPRLMLTAALSFARLLESFLGQPVDWTPLRSKPFFYLVAADSQLSTDDILTHYARLDDEYHHLRRDDRSTYVGLRPDTFAEQVTLPSSISPERIAAAVATPEVAVSTGALRMMLSIALQRARGVETLFGHRVEDVVRTAGGFVVDGRGSDGAAWSRTADLVVNCLWSGRLRIDEQMGLLPRRRWVHRLKYRVLVDLPRDLAASVPSVTMVLGKYGDIVTRDGERSAYLSWYPACLRGWATGISIPESWRGPTDNRVDPEMAADVARGTLEAFDAIVPGIARAAVTDVRAGVIVSWGATDIDDPVSELHQRRDIGVHASDGYFSIDTGKLTCAPLFAQRLLDTLERLT
jgi:glycine/D-amino acid oxidase-like deaminating enzyme